MWLKAGAARVRAHPTIVYFSIFLDAVVVGVTHDPPHDSERQRGTLINGCYPLTYILYRRPR